MCLSAEFLMEKRACLLELGAKIRRIKRLSHYCHLDELIERCAA